MTYRPAPRIEGRSAAEIQVEIRRRLAGGGPPGDSVDALVHIVGRYWEIVATRLNQALDKNYLAYLNALGVVPIPATAASVPLTFSPVPAARGAVLVPAGTQVAASGGAEPVVFQTEEALELTNLRVAHVWSLDPAHNAERDLHEVADAVAIESRSAFAGGQPSDHVVFLGDDTVLGLDHVTGVTVRVQLEETPISAFPHTVEWFIPGTPESVVLSPSADSTRGLVRSGQVVFAIEKPWPTTEFRGVRSRWLAARLSARGQGHWSVHARRIELQADVHRAGIPVDLAFSDHGDVDLTKDFYPLGTRPAFGTTFYLASREGFLHPGTRVTLAVRLTNPADAVEEPPIPRVHADGHPRIWWEYWNGIRWVRLSVIDDTRQLRISGPVSFEIPPDFVQTLVRGVEAPWIRARLVSGNYGEDERWETESPEQGMRHRRATLSPPSIQSLDISYTVAIVKVPDVVATSNERVYADRSAAALAARSFPLFDFPCGVRPGVYLGLQASGNLESTGRTISFHVLGAGSGSAFSRSDGGMPTTTATVRWQFWDGTLWLDMPVRDDTDGFSREGRVSVLLPDAARERTDFVAATPLFWLRVVPQTSHARWSPSIRGILRNTVLASHRVTVRDEILGSSHAAPDQIFRVPRTPVLEGEILQVREPLTVADLNAGEEDAPRPAFELDAVSDGDRPVLWVQWSAVDDFVASSPSDRHYVIDRAKGEVIFGDGQRGRIPPAGSSNIRLREYQAGGGARGNRAAGEVNQMRSSIPYVQSAVNPIAAAGGADLEPVERVRHRGATTVRHRRRAVTTEDYEDLARLASAQVARTHCVGLRDLAAAPFTRSVQPGVVSVIVVPTSDAVRPYPDGELLRHVREFLDRHRNPSTDLVVVGPDYVQVSITAELMLSDMSQAGTVAAQVQQAIDIFLHPLHGGTAGQGWRLGEIPKRRDLYALCASMPGIAYVSSLTLATTEDRPGVERTGHFLVASGSHHVTLGYAQLPGEPSGLLAKRRSAGAA